MTSNLWPFQTDNGFVIQREFPAAPGLTHKDSPFGPAGNHGGKLRRPYPGPGRPFPLLRGHSVAKSVTFTLTVFPSSTMVEEGNTAV